jgi:hypothetical protein
MNLSPRFARRIRPFVQVELDAAVRHESRGEFGSAFARLERAHVLGQASRSCLAAGSRRAPKPDVEPREDQLSQNRIRHRARATQ